MKSLRKQIFLSVAIVWFVVLGIDSAKAGTAGLGDLSGSWQLLVDDYLIAEKNGLTRTYHQFEKSGANPVLTGDEPWKMIRLCVRHGVAQ